MRDCFKDGLSSYCGAGFVDGIVNLALTRCKLTRRQILGCKFVGIYMEELNWVIWWDLSVKFVLIWDYFDIGLGFLI